VCANASPPSRGGPARELRFPHCGNRGGLGGCSLAVESAAGDNLRFSGVRTFARRGDQEPGGVVAWRCVHQSTDAPPSRVRRRRGRQHADDLRTAARGDLSRFGNRAIPLHRRRNRIPARVRWLANVAIQALRGDRRASRLRFANPQQGAAPTRSYSLTGPFFYDLIALTIDPTKSSPSASQTAAAAARWYHRVRGRPAP
jgi:hypothetical protein